MKILYLGTIEQYNDSGIACRTMTHTFGSRDLSFTDFVDQKSCLSWQRNGCSLKAQIAVINDDYDQGVISLGMKKWRLHFSWLPNTREFIMAWGEHMVPLDIRRSITDVRRHLNLDPVDWPAILYLDDELGEDVIVPDNVDEFGMTIVVAADLPGS